MRLFLYYIAASVLAFFLTGCSSGGADGLLGELGIGKDSVCLNSIDNATIATFKTYACGRTSMTADSFYNKIRTISGTTLVGGDGQEINAPTAPNSNSTFEIYFVKNRGSTYQLAFESRGEAATVLVAQLAGI